MIHQVGATKPQNDIITSNYAETYWFDQCIITESDNLNKNHSII